jgi:TonB-linked SusC/RagA family outer membrane protein
MSMKNKTNKTKKMGRGKLQYLLMTVFLFVGVLTGTAQHSVSGLVTDAATGEALAGVSVFNKADNKQSTLTDEEGRYSIAVPEKATLVFTLLGYFPKEINVETLTTLDVKLDVSSKMLDEMVVIGYGSIKKKDLTGAVSVIKGETLRDRTSSNSVSALQGLVPGVKVTSSGVPGTTGWITIRGLGSLTYNVPLYIVDGMVGGSDVYLNMADIESIQILKDASAAAIYGYRAAGGVVIISTKQGKKGSLKVDFDAKLSVQNLPRYDLMDAETYKYYDDLAYDEAILSGVQGVTKRQGHQDANTDWQDVMLRTALMQEYNVSLSGGSEWGNYFVSFNRLLDEGTAYGTEFDRYSFRVNTSGKKGIFSFGENLMYSRVNRKLIPINPFVDFLNIAPTIPVYDASHPGGYGYGDNDRDRNTGVNPVAAVDLLPQTNPEKAIRGNAYGQIDLFDMLSAKVNLSYMTYMGSTNALRKRGVSALAGGGANESSLGVAITRNEEIYLDNTLNFKHTFNKHDINVTAGMSYSSYVMNHNWITRLDPLTIGDKYIESMDSATGTTTAGGWYEKVATISYFGRINYSYDDRYLLQATARRDGTSRLPTKGRWDNFGALSLGWRISQEAFFDVPFIDDLKLRANYGSLGNSAIGVWDFQEMVNIAPRAVFGSPEYKMQGMIQSRISNDDLVWERKVMANIGLDAALFNNRLTLAFEWYDATSYDLLVSIPILATTGNQGGAPMVNAASLQNRGVEMELGWRDKIGKDFSYFVSANFSTTRNKVLEIGYEGEVYYQNVSKTEVGQPLGIFYLHKMLGIFQTEADVQNYRNSEGRVIMPNALPGDIIYDDYNDDGQITADDRQVVGNPWPDVEAGVSLGAAWKGLDLSINGYGRFGHDVYNGAAAIVADFTGNQNNFNGIVPWTPEQPVKNAPRIVYGDTRNVRADQDRWLEDGSFFRIRDISLGYSLPKPICAKVGIDKVRVGVTLQNFFTFTNYSGLDPEFQDSGIFSLAVDSAMWPNPRTVIFSFSLGF